MGKRKKCNKKPFGSANAAKVRLKHIRETSEEEVVPVRYYRCSTCKKYHLTSGPEMKRDNSHKRKKRSKKKTEHKSRKRSMRQRLSSYDYEVDQDALSLNPRHLRRIDNPEINDMKRFLSSDGDVDEEDKNW